MEIAWWMWLVGGLGLILAELAITSFFVVWFGLGALIVGALLWLWPGLPLSAQLAVWTLASSGMVFLWLRVFRPGVEAARIGQAQGEAIGEIGLLVNPVEAYGKGSVRFQRPLMGAEAWPCLADEAIPAGTRVRVVAVEGGFVKVVPA